MKFKTNYLLLLIVAVLTPSVGHSQYIQGQTYVCQQTVDSITIDGKANETSWASAQWTQEFVDIEESKNQPLT